MNRNLKEFVNHGTKPRAGTEVAGPQHVAILLAHYNGGAHLRAQLDSIAAQTHADWSLIISDDGSGDDWLATASEFSAQNAGHRIWLTTGPGKGFARNFLSLVAMAGPTVPFAAFCDQDDVWLPAKLSRALLALNSVPSSRPALYCGRTMVCDENLEPLQPSPLFAFRPGFCNALVQSIAGGNTMVMNRAALDLLQDTLRCAKTVVAHDWWAYQLISGAGGTVIYDAEPGVLYRQHAGNRIGANSGAIARARRLRQLSAGQFRDWNHANATALAEASHWLTPEARETLQLFQIMRNRGFVGRIAAFRRAGIYRQTRLGQLALWVAVALRLA